MCKKQTEEEIKHEYIASTKETQSILKVKQKRRLRQGYNFVLDSKEKRTQQCYNTTDE